MEQETAVGGSVTENKTFLARELHLRQRDEFCRMAICGGPNVGKTTLSDALAELIPVVHTDYFIDHTWQEQPELIMAGLADQKKFLVEGVQVARCLRKGLDVDIAVWLDVVRTPITVRQRGLAKGVAKIFRDWLDKKPESTVVFYL